MLTENWKLRVTPDDDGALDAPAWADIVIVGVTEAVGVTLTAANRREEHPAVPDTPRNVTLTSAVLSPRVARYDKYA